MLVEIASAPNTAVAIGPAGTTEGHLSLGAMERMRERAPKAAEHAAFARGKAIAEVLNGTIGGRRGEADELRDVAASVYRIIHRWLRDWGRGDLAEVLAAIRDPKKPARDQYKKAPGAVAVMRGLE